MNEKQASVAARIADLACLPMSELWSLWDRYFPAAAALTTRTARTSSRASPTNCRRSLWRPRARDEAGWRPSAQSIPRSSCGPPREFNFAPGTVILREWGDRDHRVTVTAEGRFEYEGQHLQEFDGGGRHITGQHWSGPLFFGLTGKGGTR